MIYIPTNSPFRKSFPLAFRYRNASGRDGKISLADASSFDNANLATLKQVIGYALEFPDLNETTLAAIDSGLHDLADLAETLAKQSPNDKQTVTASKNTRELWKWYAAQRGLDDGMETTPFPASYELPSSVVKAASGIACEKFTRAVPTIVKDPARLFICDGNCAVWYRGVPQELMELHPKAADDPAGSASLSRTVENMLLLKSTETTLRDYETDPAYTEVDIGSDFKAYVSLWKKTRGNDHNYPAFIAGKDADGGNLSDGRFYNAELIAKVIDAMPGEPRAFMLRKSETIAVPLIFITENAVALCMNVRDVKAITPQESRDMLCGLRRKQKRIVSHTRNTKGETAMPKAKKQTATQEIRPTAVQESKPHIPWTIPDVTAAIGNIMPRLQAVGIVSAHLDDQHRSHVDGKPTPRIKLTNKHGVELPFGDFSCVEKWLAEQEAKQPTAPQHTKITREDIERALLCGTGFKNGKQRVIEQFAKHEGMIKNADFLKKEYGIGGWSHAFGDDTWLDHDGNGITLTLGDLTKPTDRELIPWTDAAAIINTLITQGKYTADAPQETKPTAPQPKQETKPSAPAKKPAPAPKQETRPTPAPKKPQEKQTPAESIAASARKAAPNATVEVKGAQTSCPIVWVYKATAKEADALSALGFVWSNKRQGYWMKPTALSAQESA